MALSFREKNSHYYGRINTYIKGDYYEYQKYCCYVLYYSGYYGNYSKYNYTTKKNGRCICK